MARSGDVGMTFNPRFFETVMRDPRVEKLVDAVGEQVLKTAKRDAPVDSGDYERGLRIEHRDAEHRRVTRVVGTDRKTLLIESKTGNLARSLKGAKR